MSELHGIDKSREHDASPPAPDLPRPATSPEASRSETTDGEARFTRTDEDTSAHQGTDSADATPVNEPSFTRDGETGELRNDSVVVLPGQTDPTFDRVCESDRNQTPAPQPREKDQVSRPVMQDLAIASNTRADSPSDGEAPTPEPHQDIDDEPGSHLEGEEAARVGEESAEERDVPAEGDDAEAPPDQVETQDVGSQHAGDHDVESQDVAAEPASQGDGNDRDSQTKPDSGDRQTDELATHPTGELGGAPDGEPTRIRPNEDADVRRSLERENSGAATLADKGYQIKQNPSLEEVAQARQDTGDTGRPTSKPDYLLEGRVFDCYSPSENKGVRGIWSEVETKIKDDQTRRVVVNLEGWRGNMSDLRQQFNDWPNEHLKEVKVITSDGDVVQIIPNQSNN